MALATSRLALAVLVVGSTFVPPPASLSTSPTIRSVGDRTPGPTLERSRFHDGDPHNAIVARRGVRPPLVALSFDDGPVPGATRRILAFLRRERAHATFFEIGRRARRHPEIVRAQLAAGHEVASHTWSHRRLVPLTRGALLTEIVDGATALQRVTGRRPNLFRSPHGYFDRRVSAAVAAAGLRLIGWDIAIDSAAYGRDTRAAARLVLDRVRPGSIVLAHDLPKGGPRAIAVLSIVLPQLRRRGLRVVTVSELLRAPAHPAAIASSSPPPVPYT